MWDLPRPGLEPVSPALAGRFSTTAPPGKPLELLLEPLRWYKIISMNYNFHNPLMDGFYQFVKSHPLIRRVASTAIGGEWPSSFSPTWRPGFPVCTVVLCFCRQSRGLRRTGHLTSRPCPVADGQFASLGFPVCTRRGRIRQLQRPLPALAFVSIVGS